MALRKTKTTPRKSPKQERSAATVEAILQAATYILLRHGWEGLTTNRIAERAGVNIASLYQYFPNKQSIVIELQRRHVAKAREGLPRFAPELKSQKSLRGMLDLMIRAGVEEHRVAPALHKVFTEELPRSTRKALRDSSSKNIKENWTELVRPHLKNVPDLELAAFIAETAVHAIIHEAATERPELLERDDFVQEIVTLLERYFRR